MIKVWATITLLSIFAPILTRSVLAENLKPETVFSFEGSYFIPRRSDFKRIYGNGFPVVGARLDIPLKRETSLSIKIRYFRMSEIDDLNFTNVSLGSLLKRTYAKNEVMDFYVAGGVQIEYRRIGFNPLVYRSSSGDIFRNPSWAQWEIAPSIAVEGGIDLWILSAFKLSPNIGFHYFPYFLFGDPTRGDFGDTGGFMFSASLGFRL